LLFDGGEPLKHLSGSDTFERIDNQ
jgi:hypothetical protein